MFTTRGQKGTIAIFVLLSFVRHIALDVCPGQHTLDEREGRMKERWSGKGTLASSSPSIHSTPEKHRWNEGVCFSFRSLLYLFCSMLKTQLLPPLCCATSLSFFSLLFSLCLFLTLLPYSERLFAHRPSFFPSPSSSASHSPFLPFPFSHSHTHLLLFAHGSFLVVSLTRTANVRFHIKEPSCIVQHTFCLPFTYPHTYIHLDIGHQWFIFLVFIPSSLYLINTLIETYVWFTSSNTL